MSIKTFVLQQAGCGLITLEYQLNMRANRKCLTLVHCQITVGLTLYLHDTCH